MLESLSNTKLKQSVGILPRRFSLSSHNIEGRIHLHGAPKCGKTAIALDFARSFKSPFYVDFNDLRNSYELIQTTLLKISMEKKADIIVLDNIPSDFIALPHCKMLITISQRKSHIENFINREILPLSFEEFVSFDKSTQSITQLFNNFIKHGNLPITLHLKDTHIEQIKQENLRLIFGTQIDIIRYIFSLQGLCVSINQIYLNLKKTHKISKDSIYSLIADLEARGIIYLIAHFSSARSPKKLMIYDFSVNNALNHEKNFIAIFENAVFMELLKFEKPIFYCEKINLICDNIAYIIAPFATIEGIKRLVESFLDKVDLSQFREIIVITMEVEGEFSVDMGDKSQGVNLSDNKKLQSSNIGLQSDNMRRQSSNTRLQSSNAKLQILVQNFTSFALD